MTQTTERWHTPTGTVARRVKELRQRRGWSAERLARACAEAGMPELNRSIIANMESGRRAYVTLEEAFTFAYVLDVAPVHLMVPTDDEEGERYLATPEGLWATVGAARAWVRGDWCPPSSDPRAYWSEVPAEEFRPGPPSDEQIADSSDGLRHRRGIVDDVKEAQERWRQQHGED